MLNVTVGERLAKFGVSATDSPNEVSCYLEAVVLMDVQGIPSLWYGPLDQKTKF
jgi:hypothetical protein